jgi:hypothetical protein
VYVYTHTRLVGGAGDGGAVGGALEGHEVAELVALVVAGVLWVGVMSALLFGLVWSGHDAKLRLVQGKGGSAEWTRSGLVVHTFGSLRRSRTVRLYCCMGTLSASAPSHTTV